MYFIINLSFWQAALKYFLWLPCFLNWLWFYGSRFQNGGYACKLPKMKIVSLAIGTWICKLRWSQKSYDISFRERRTFWIIFCYLGLICWEMIDWRLFNSGEKKSIITQKNITFVFDHKFRHFPDLPVLRDFVCIEPKGLPTTYQKISIVTKWVFFCDKIRHGWVGTQKNFDLRAFQYVP